MLAHMMSHVEEEHLNCTFPKSIYTHLTKKETKTNTYDDLLVRYVHYLHITHKITSYLRHYMANKSTIKLLDDDFSYTKRASAVVFDYLKLCFKN